MRFPSTLSALALLSVLTAAACSEAGDPLSIDATGALAGRAFLDRNGNNQLDAGVDAPAAGIRVALLRGVGDTVATALTDAGGVARFLALPVGSYRVVLDPAALGDTLRLVKVDSARVTVAAADTPMVTLTLGYPVVTAAQLRQMSPGKPVTLEGVALHTAHLFGDSSLHVADSTGVVRVTGILPRTTVAAGDRVRVLGRVGLYAGRRALVESSAFVLGSSQVPSPRVLSSAAAASARGGGFDGALVQVPGTRIISSAALPGGDVRVRVTDGSGPLDVLLDKDVGLTSEEPLLPGVRLEVTGILFPKEGSTEWQLKPRHSSDLVATVPEVKAAEIRGLAPGSLVAIRAIALNGLATFGDNSLHLADPSGAIRAVNVGSNFLFAGDSVRVLGIVGVREGQTVLTPARATVLGKSTVPPPALVSTQAAATANGGKLDAALVEVRSAAIDSVASVGGDVALRVDDGSGRLVVLIDRDTGIGTSAFVAGDRVDVVGLLVPTGAGTWVLKPRSPADVVRR
jgi:hypothetical protein